MGPGDLNRDQDVPALGLGALPAGDLDQVISELRQHRLRQGVERHREGRGVERRVHAPLGPLPQIAAVGGADAVGRLSPRHVRERRAARDFGAHRVHPRLGGGGVPGRGEPGQRHEAQIGGCRPAELVEMRLVVGIDLGVAQVHRRVGDDVSRNDGGEPDLGHLVLVAVLLPQLRVGEEHVGGDDPQQLGPLELLAVLRFERRQVLLGHARGEPALILADVELAVGLELGDLLELGGRRVAHGLDDLVLAHGDPAALVLRVEHGVLDELLPDLVPDLRDVLQAEPPGRLALPGVDVLLDDGLKRPQVDALAVDLAHRGLGEQAGGAGDATEVDDQPGKEREGHDHHQWLGRIPKRLHHMRIRDSGPVVGSKRAISLSGSTQNLKAAHGLAVDRRRVARYCHQTSHNQLHSAAVTAGPEPRNADPGWHLARSRSSSADTPRTRRD